MSDDEFSEHLIYAEGIPRAVGDYAAYNLALAHLTETQERELYDLRMQHCAERMQLLHRFGAQHIAAPYWRAQMERITRKFQARVRARKNPVNIL